MEDFTYTLDCRTEIGDGAKFLMFRSNNAVEIVLISYRNEHALAAHEIIEEKRGEPVFIGAGVILSGKREIFYESPSCRNKEEGFGKDRPDNSEEANAHIIHLRTLLGWS